MDDLREKQIRETRERMMNTLDLLNEGQTDLSNNNPSYNQQNINEINKQPIYNQNNSNYPNKDSSQNLNDLNNSDMINSNIERPVTENTQNTQGFVSSTYFNNIMNELRSDLQKAFSTLNNNICNIQNEFQNIKKDVSQVNSTNIVEKIEQMNSRVRSIQCAIDSLGSNTKQNIQSNQNTTNTQPTQSSSQNYAEPKQQVQSEQKSSCEPTGHPRTGGFTPDDVKIENVFYCGKK
jgi:hypothetical protein